MTWTHRILAALVAASAVLLIYGTPAAYMSLQEPERVAGTGSLSGMVEASKPYKAASVYARNIDKNIRYMTYTHQGRYRAVHMFPGQYEVTVQKNGFAADIHRVTVQAGENSVLNFVLRAAKSEPVQQSAFGGSPNAWRWDRNQVQLVSFSSLFPPGPDYELVRDNCMRCHGLNFFPSRPSSAARWERGIDLMSDPKARLGIMIPPGTLDRRDRERIVAYLSTNFGPDTPRRALRVEPEMPLDEEALARAMYIEYGIPEDGRAGDTHFDSAGNVWFSDTSDRISRLDPRTGEFIRSYAIPNGLTASPHDLEVDNQGEIWWVDNVSQLGRLDPKTGTVVNYPIRGHGHSHTVDSQQNVWFSLSWEHQIGKWDRKTQQVTLWKPPSPYSNPMGIVVDQADKVWFAGYRSCQVVQFDPSTAKFTEYPALMQPCTSPSLAVDSKGSVWYSVTSRGKLGRLDPKTGQRFEHEMPAAFSAPRAVFADPDDNIWASDGGNGGALVRFDPPARRFTYYPTPQVDQHMRNIQVTREGAIWYGVQGNSGVGVLYPDVNRVTTLGAFRMN